MRIGNCYLFVLRRWYASGGTICLRTSRYGWWFHAFWTKDYESFEDFVPNWPKSDWPSRIVPPVWFRGKVRVWTREQLRRGGY